MMSHELSAFRICSYDAKLSVAETIIYAFINCAPYKQHITLLILLSLVINLHSNYTRYS